MRRSYRLITLGTIDMQLLKVAEEKRRLERIVKYELTVVDAIAAIVLRGVCEARE